MSEEYREVVIQRNIALVRNAALEAENAALRERTRWIPVSSGELPEEGQGVLATGLVRGLHEPFCWNHYSYSTRGWFTETFTHWMPLPEAPKEEE